jgi:predicted DNA-binding helix-hairpin-helix protein
VVFDGAGNLPLAHDPKTAWALAHPERFPVEVRTAPYEELVRVPGIGPGAAKKHGGRARDARCCGRWPTCAGWAWSAPARRGS